MRKTVNLQLRDCLPDRHFSTSIVAISGSLNANVFRSYPVSLANQSLQGSRRENKAQVHNCVIPRGLRPCYELLQIVSTRAGLPSVLGKKAVDETYCRGLDTSSACSVRKMVTNSKDKLGVLKLLGCERIS